MSSEHSSDVKFEIGHVLFIDIVGYSKLLLDEQKERLRRLTDIVLATAQVREATNERLVKLPAGDGMALVFRNNSEEPARCALEIADALKSHPEIAVRMGIHSGPVSEVTDVSGRTNIAGGGINMARRVMDCGDAGHILLSKHVADDLQEHRRWSVWLHDLGECEVKHGVRLGIVNLYRDGAGNPQLPKKFKALKKRHTGIRWAVVAATLLAVAAILGGVAIFSRSRERSMLAVAEKSIAVLPFENLSEDKANAFFASGIQDEILMRLAKIGDLKVISRTSTQQYQSKPANLREIAKQLGVANILEGSVQRIENRVHINVQLIRAATDTHLWAESYDRELQNIFGVEGEVAGTIAEALKARLTKAEAKELTDKPTTNLAAYDAYLRARAFENIYSSHNQEALAALKEAVRLDPSFALAWADKAILQSYLYFVGESATNTPAEIKEAADRAMALRPDAAESLLAQGYYVYRVKRDFLGGLQAFENARERSPNNQEVYFAMSAIEKRLGRWEEGRLHLQQAIELDPRSQFKLMDLVIDYLIPLRRFAEAQATLDRAWELAPADAGVVRLKALAHQKEGLLDEAARDLALLPPSEGMFLRGMQCLYRRQFDQAIDFIQRDLEVPPDGQGLTGRQKSVLIVLGQCQNWAGRPEDARATFKRAIHEIKATSDTVVPIDEQVLPGALALAYGYLGEKEKAMDQARRAVEAYNGDAWTQPLAEVMRAQVEVIVGNLDNAVAALPRLLKIPNGLTQTDLKLDPIWDPLRNDPRFQKLCQETQS
jgi:TolB-like protein/Tfp pilus assembly protein PilF